MYIYWGFREKHEGLSYNCVQTSRIILSLVLVEKNKKKHSKVGENASRHLACTKT